MERFAPSQVGKGGFAQAMRLGGFLGVAGGFLYFYQRSIRTSTPRLCCSMRPIFTWEKADVSCYTAFWHEKAIITQG